MFCVCIGPQEVPVIEFYKENLTKIFNKQNFKKGHRRGLCGDRNAGAAGAGPGPQVHPDIYETFHVLEGEIELSTEKGRHLAKKGDFVCIPAGGAVHAFRNTADQLAKLWCTVIPAGLETNSEVDEGLDW